VRELFYVRSSKNFVKLSNKLSTYYCEVCTTASGILPGEILQYSGAWSAAGVVTLQPLSRQPRHRATSDFQPGSSAANSASIA